MEAPGRDKKRDENMKEKVPIYHKQNLTLEEAAEYSNIGINKIRDISNDPRCKFVIFVGKKRLIKRKEFEKYKKDSLTNQFEWITNKHIQLILQSLNHFS